MLNPDGFLLLGAAEMPLSIDKEFDRIEYPRSGCYQLIKGGRMSDSKEFISQVTPNILPILDLEVFEQGDRNGKGVEVRNGQRAN